MAGKIVIDVETCKGCGLCVWACPQDCIVISSRSNTMGYFPAQTNNADCTGCALCALICPDVAIEVYRESTVAVGADKKHNNSGSGIGQKEKT